MSRRFVDTLFLLLLLVYAGSATWMALRLPAHAAPNEWLNYEYVVVMRETGRWPNRGAVDEKLRYTEWHQPPVYFTVAYLLGLPWPHPDPAQPFPPYAFVPHSPDAALIDGVPPPLGFYDNPFFTATHSGNLNPAIRITPAGYPTLYAARLAAALLGVVALVALYAAGRATFSPAVALLMASLLAFQPNFLHLSGAVNNDMPLTAVGTLTLAVATAFVRRPRPLWHYLGLGGLVALTILTKTNGVFVGALMVPLLLFEWRRRGFGSAALAGVASLVGLGTLWGAWLWRNARLTRDTLGLAGSFPVQDVLLQNPLNVRFLLPELPRIWRSFWLDWTAGDIAYPADWIYVLWVGLLAVALAGWLARAAYGAGRDSAESTPTTTRWTHALFLAAGAAITYLYFMVKAGTILGAGFIVPEGRWLLPVLPALAWFAAAGFAYWWPAKWRDRACVAAAALPMLFTVGLLLTLLPRLYPRAQAVAAAPSAAVSYQYGPVRLLDAAAAPLVAGQLSDVTLWWEAVSTSSADLVVSTQLLAWQDGDWRKLDEQNSFHGLGLTPSSQWQVGDVWRDRVTLKAADDIDQPTRAVVVVSVLDGDGVLAAARDGAPVALPVVAETVVRSAQPRPVPDAARRDPPVTFGGLFELAGWQRSGDRLVLWWRATADVATDFTVFAHAVDADGQIVVQSDTFPAQGSAPTSIWRAGDVIRDEHVLPGVDSADSILVGVYNSADLTRLPAQQDNVRLRDDVVRLTP